jgi:hypothetical protein
MMEPARFSETLVAVYQATRCHTQEDRDVNIYRREILKFFIWFYLPGAMDFWPWSLQSVRFSSSFGTSEETELREICL